MRKPRIFPRSRSGRFSKLVLLLLGMSSPVRAHDMWVVTDVAGAQGKICARIGERFPDSVNSVTADRVRQFAVHTEAGRHELSGSFADNQFCAPLPAGVTNGLVEMVVQPRINSIDARRFAEFVKGEGLSHVVGEARTNGPVTYLYSRYSKLLFGQLSGRATRPMGHLLEIIPDTDPASLKAGAALRVQVMFLGKPLARAQVAAAHEGASGEAFEFPVKATTDENGWATLQLTRPGLWYARLIHTIPSADPEFQWHHFFATLTFRAAVASPRAGRLSATPQSSIDDFSTDLAAFEELKKLKAMTTPVTVIDGSVIIGFDTEKLEAALA